MLLFMVNAMSDRRRGLKCVSIQHCKMKKSCIIKRNLISRGSDYRE